MSLTLLAGDAALVTIASALDYSPALGYSAACALSALVGFVLVRLRLRTLLSDTFQSQPFRNAA